MKLYLKRKKKFLKKALVGCGLFLVGTMACVLTRWLVNAFSPTPWTAHPSFAVFIMTLVAIVAYKPLDFWVTQLFKNYMFKYKSYSHVTLMNLAEELSLVLNLSELSNLVVNTFGEVFRLKTVALLVAHPAQPHFEVASAYGWKVSESKRIRISSRSTLFDLIRSSGPHVLVRDRVIRTLSWQEASRLAHDFDRLRSSWVIPLFVQDDLIGVLAFAAPSPHSVFDDADYQCFREFARVISKSIQNALYVSQLRESYERLKDEQSRLVLDSTMTAIEHLASGIAHEIHNPLTVISGKTQVLLLQKDRAPMEERVEQVLKTIVNQTKRAAEITRRLLMFSQGSNAVKESVRLEQVLEDTIALVSYQTSLEGIEISRVIRGSIPALTANVHELREVFLNLLLNAIQSLEGPGKIRCEISFRSRDQIFEISVADNGQGIPPENLEKVFNPFFTTRSEAVGLGLFVVRQIIHRYGGSIRAESQGGKGSLFLVDVPLVSPEEAKKPRKELSVTINPETSY